MGKSGTNRATREGVRPQQPQVLFAGAGDAFLPPPTHGRRLDVADEGHGGRAAEGVDHAVGLLDSSVHAPILGAPNSESNRPPEDFSEYASGMTALKDRLRLAMKEAGITKQVQLAKKIGVAPPSVNDWLSGKTQTMGGENLLKVSRLLNVNATWLATGKGSPYPGSGEETVSEPVEPVGLASQFQRLDPAILVESENWALIFRDAEGGNPKDDLRKMELLAEVYEQIVMDGGRLSGEHHRQYVDRANKSTRGKDEQGKELGRRRPKRGEGQRRYPVSVDNQ